MKASPLVSGSKCVYWTYCCRGLMLRCGEVSVNLFMDIDFISRRRLHLKASRSWLVFSGQPILSASLVFMTGWCGFGLYVL